MATLTDPTGRGRKARTITATDPATGATLTRSTDRIYWAAVVFTASSGKVTAAAWAGRPDLAAKALAQRGGAANGYRLAPVTGDPWAAPGPAAPAAPVAPDPTPEPTPDPLAAAAADLATALEPHPDSLQAEGRRLAAARVTLPGEPPAAPPVPPAPGGGVAAHRAAAAAGRPVSLAALARDLGRGLGLASGGRLPARYGATGDLPARPAPAAALTGDPLEGLPWDPGTPEARARHAEQGRTAARLYPIAQAATGAGCTLPPSWWNDGPALNGELPPMRALEALPLPTLAAAAAALAALPPVTEAQAQGLAYCRAALRAAAARL